MTHRRDLLRAMSAAALLPLSGCASIGPGRLDRDQLDYTRAVADSSKRQTLFNIVRLRFGDAPAFVAINQLVSSHSLQRSGNASFEAFPSAPPSSFWSLFAGVQYTDTPTFTMQPVNGEQFVQSYLRPFAPTEIVPMIAGGVPVDLLFRLVLQSVGPLQNTHPMASGARSGSAEFLPVLARLRTLQVAGVLRTQVRKEKEGSRAFILFDTSHAPTLQELVEDVYERLGVASGASEVEVVYGRLRERVRTHAIPILSRPMLSVLGAVAAEIEVREEDVRAGRTIPTLTEPGGARPVLIVHSGPTAPDDAYAAVRVAGRWYWVADNDFASKIAFTIIELLKSVAESTQGQNTPVLTIPTR
jgi:hypothetical protein